MTDGWTMHGAEADELDILETNCTLAGKIFSKTKRPDGKYTVTCMPPATAATATGFGGPIVAAAALPPDKRRADLKSLHPVVRRRVQAVQKQLDDENIPLKVFETFRSPQRQAELYAKGRTAPGARVTNAQPWESWHQYGMAADFVRFENGGWNWNDATAAQRAEWDRFHEIALAKGLEPLSWERPHVQLADHTLTRLRGGDYPDGGDADWADALSEAIAGWTGPGAPPHPEDANRPALPLVAGLAGAGGADWHSQFGGDPWAYDTRGVYTMNPDGSRKLWRSPGAPITVQEVLARLGGPIARASARHGVAQELIVMTIATEAGGFRRDGFTGPGTFRWESGYVVRATGDATLDGRERGDYSAGPMQVMSDTARWMNNVLGLGHANDRDFTFFKTRPNPRTEHIGLFDADLCIDVGTAYIKWNMSATGGDPLLVAAAYNAGGLYPSSANHWRLRSHGNHIDRAAEWYGDACFVLYG